MPTTDPNVLKFSCPGCGAHYDFPAAMSGRSGRCAKCGTSFAIPTAATTPPQGPPALPTPPQKKEHKKSSSEPEYVGLECRVCQTRMYGRLADVGRKMKCPDCGALTRIPPPPPLKTPNMPAALDGEQYELWGADEQPQPSNLLAHQPTYIAVTCRKCATLMYAGESQIGQTIHCPDCNAKHVVPPPHRPKPRTSVLATDATTPKVDSTRDPGERPHVFSPEAQQRIDEEAKGPTSEYGDKLDHRGHAIPPRWPLITGIFPFPFYAGCRFRWAVLTLLLWMPAGLLVDGVPGWVNWQGDTAGALAAMGGLAETMVGAVVLIVWSAAASSIFITIVSESSEGHDHIAKWPPLNFIDSMSEMLPVTVAIMFAAAPGWALGYFLGLEPWQLALLTGGTLLAGFPVTLLSQLSGGSTWDLIEPRVVVGMFFCPLSTLFFYIETAILAAVCVSAAIAIAQYHHLLPLTLAPLYVACAMIYARLLGRLGLRLAQVMPARAEEL